MRCIGGAGICWSTWARRTSHCKTTGY